jgi:hypothetical protein
VRADRDQRRARVGHVRGLAARFDGERHREHVLAVHFLDVLVPRETGSDERDDVDLRMTDARERRVDRGDRRYAGCDDGVYPDAGFAERDDVVA